MDTRIPVTIITKARPFQIMAPECYHHSDGCIFNQLYHLDFVNRNRSNLTLELHRCNPKQHQTTRVILQALFLRPGTMPITSTRFIPRVRS
jgi:hypothetical protein